MISSIKFQGGFIVSSGIAAISLSPVLFILASGMNADPDIWSHLKQYVLPGLLKNTAILVAGVVSVTAALGISLAWLTSFYEFWGRRLFEKWLIFPLAIPTYVMAFIYTGLLDYSGPVQTAVREYAPELAGLFPEIRSGGGAIMVISLAIFPYVFLMASSGFRSMGRSMVEASQSLGGGRMFTLFRVTLPMARPWIFGGLILVFMETLADFGAVSVFNYDTFTTGIYKAWYGLFSVNAAAQLASILVVMVLVIVAAESWLRRKQKFFNRGGHQPVSRKRLNGTGHFLASAFCSTVLLVSFVIPAVQLLIWTAKAFAVEFGAHYIRLVANTFFLGLMGTAVTLAVAVSLSYSGRRRADLKTGIAAKLSLSGYALPGTVLAVGIIHVVAWLDSRVTGTMDMLGIQLQGALLQGSLILLPLCYMIRFLTVGYNPVSSHMTRLTPSIDEAARLMKVTGPALLSKIHLPLIRKGMVTGGILVLVEIFKEMPVTLMLRPFGWDTLAVKIFELTSEGEWERAALPAVTLVLAGMIPVGFLTFIGRSKKQHVPEG
jgi:iron(III) transport system permease protein